MSVHIYGKVYNMYICLICIHTYIYMLTSEHRGQYLDATYMHTYMAYGEMQGTQSFLYLAFLLFEH